jgi:regulator of sigma E protease
VTSIISIVLGLLVLGVLVFIHELGHFLAAKSCKIKVLAFSLGFGTPIFKKKVGDTEYMISSIPFGGYVKMAGENPEERTEGQGSPDDFPSKPIWQRAFVAIAGPAANIISAMVMLLGMYLWGVDKPVYLENTLVGAVADSSMAEQAGIMPGDSIVSINGKNVTSWDEIQKAFAQQEVSYTVTYSRNGTIGKASIVNTNSKVGLPENPLMGLFPPLPAVIASVLKSSAASEAGLLAGDTVRMIDSQNVYSWFHLTSIVEDAKDETALNVIVSRNGKEVSLSVTPRYSETEKRKLLGIQVAEGDTRIVRYPLGEAIDRALKKTWEYTIMIFEVIGKLVSRRVSASQLSGPVGIIPASGLMAMQGFSQLLDFMALIGINLGVLNLMPLVITDGGLLLFLLIEAIRRKPLSIKVQSIINRIAIAFFLMLFLYVTFNDVMRLPDIFKLFR